MEPWSGKLCCVLGQNSWLLCRLQPLPKFALTLKDLHCILVNRFTKSMWLFLSKHKLELMFSSTEPCAPRGRIFPATFSLLFVPQTCTRIPLILPANACVLRLPANQLHAVFPCLYSGSQSILTCNSVKLRDSSVYFVHSPISRANLLFYKQSRPTTQNSPRRSFNSCANKAAFQLQATDRLLSRASRHNNNNLSGPGSCSLSARAKCQKITSTHVHTAELNPDDESREDPDDQAAIPPPNANTTGEEPLNEAQPPTTTTTTPLFA